MTLPHLPAVLLDCSPVAWAFTVKYLGVYVVSGKKLAIDVTLVKQCFAAVTPFMPKLKILMNYCTIACLS